MQTQNNTTIPKIIHYCWFGRNPLPPLATKCIESWEKYMPEYEIKVWNEDNFDITINSYVEEAYHLKKYAFVSDYARFWVLYNYGGVYFDVDVELLQPIDDILDKGPYMGLELLYGPQYKNLSALPNPGLGMATCAHLEILKDFLACYKNKHFISFKGKPNFKTIVITVTDVLLERGNTLNSENISFCEGLYLYPNEYFNPRKDATGELQITSRTRSIHHYAGSWVNHKHDKGLVKHYKRFLNVMLRVKLSIKRSISHQQ